MNEEMLLTSEKLAIEPILNEEKPTFIDKAKSVLSSVNTGYNLYQQGKAIRENEAKMTKVSLSSDALWAEIKDLPQNEREYIISVSDEINTNVDLAAKLSYYKQKAKNDEIYNSNFNTLEKLVYGLTGSVVDVDTPLLAIPFLGGSVKGARTINTLVGATTAAASTMAHNYATDKDIMQHVPLATVFGGTLGNLSTSLFKNISKESDVFVDETKLVATTDAKKAKEMEIESLQNDISKVDDAIKTFGSIQSTVGKHEEALKAVLANEKVDTKALVESLKTTFKESITKTNDKIVEVSTKAKEVKSMVTTMVKEQNYLVKTNEKVLKTLQKEAEVIEKDISPLVKLSEEAEALSIKQAEATAKITDLYENKIVPLQQALNEVKANTVLSKKHKERVITKLSEDISKAQAQIKELKVVKKTKPTITKEQQSLLKQKIAELEAKQKQAEAVVSGVKKQLADNATVIATGKKELSSLETQIADLQRVKEEVLKHQKYIPVNESVIGGYASKVLPKLEKSKALLIPNNFKEFLDKRGSLIEEVAKLKDDKFDINNLQRIKKYKENALLKLNRELEEISGTITTLEGLKNNAAIKSTPDWMQKLMISPIGKLSTSSNPYIRGLASKLHESSIYTGLVEKHNAKVVRHELDNELTTRLLAVRGDWIKHRQDVDKNISFDEYLTKVSVESYNVITKMQMDAVRGIHAGLDTEAFRAEMIRKLSGATRQFVPTVDKTIQSSVNHILDYFELVFKRGQSAGIAGFQNTAGKGYLARVGDASKIEALNAIDPNRARQLLIDAQVKYKTAINGVVDNAAMEEFGRKADAFVKGTLDRENALKITVDGIENGTQNTSRLGERSIEAFDGDLLPVLSTDIGDILGKYKLAMHGRIALQETVGVSSLAEFKTQLLDKIEGKTADDVDNLVVVVQTILGTREIAKHPFDTPTRAIKGLSSVSSVLAVPGFLASTLTEFSQIVTNYGFKGLLSNTVGQAGSMHKIYAKGEPSSQNLIWGLGDFGEALLGNNMARYEADNLLDSAGSVQRVLDIATIKGSLYGGLQVATDSLRLISQAAFVDYVARLSAKKTLSRSDKFMLNDMGITIEQLANIKKTLGVTDKGLITNRNRETWGELGNELRRASMVMVDRTILHPSAATLPKFMTDYSGGAWMPRLFTKFLRFPVESYERMLVRGIQKRDALVMAGVATNIALWAAVIQAKDSLLPEEQQKYSKGTDEELQQLLLMSAFNNTFTSSAVALGDKLSMIATGEGLQGYSASVSPVTTKALDIVQYGKLEMNVPFGRVGVDLSKGQARIMNQLAQLYEVDKAYEVNYRRKTIWESDEDEE